MERLRKAWSPRRNAKALFEQPSSANRAASLDGLRALAVLWVLLYHVFGGMPYGLFGSVYLNPVNMATYKAMSDSFFMRVVHNGPLGVDIFFVLSGCLIMTILHRDVAEAMAASAAETTRRADGGESATTPLLGGAVFSAASTELSRQPTLTRTIRHFFLRRYFRIMPAYAVALIVGAIVESVVYAGVTGPTPCEAYWWRNVLFIQNFFPDSEMCLLWSWSIAVEIQMYLVSPAVVWAVLRWPRRAVHILGSLAFVSLALYMGLYTMTPPEGSYYNRVSVGGMPFTRMFAYFFGMLIPVAIDQTKERLAGADWAPSRRHLILRALSIFNALVIAVCSTTNEALAPNRAVYILQVLVARPLFVAATAFIMYDCLLPRVAGADRYQEFINRILGSRPLFVLAQLSYSIYLIHSFYMSIIYSSLFEDALLAGDIAFTPQWIFPVVAVIVLALTTASAAVVFFLVEKPAMTLCNDLLHDKRHQTVPADRGLAAASTSIQDLKLAASP